MYNFEDLVNIIAKLRAPGGCPWDMEQTHESMKGCLLDEAQEVLEAIDAKDDENLCEELGDLLLQVVMHAQIAAEEGRFTLRDLAVNGRDLMDAGIEAGPKMKEILSQLLDLVLSEQLPNEKESLLAHAQNTAFATAAENA